MKKILLILLLMSPLLGFAQQPKMYIKLFGGINSATYVYRIEGVDSDILLGWQLGGSFRVSHRKAFLETGITFVDYGMTLYITEDADLELEEPLNIQMRALEVPINLGYIPVQTPVFRWFLYGGLVNRFSLKGRYEFEGEEGTFKPKDAELHFYNLGARFGTQVDIAMFNFDFNYTIGVTNGFRNRVRTNIHTLQFSVGFLF
jgi:hypothetical protein